ncbi:complement C5 [Pseudonaja textilis]|uniref:complement C5 n=1 Tax=Pseudonaja textilis TaxID=8673 RepID=UPI000EA8C85D|nr:complement C5 [Pseudonaja textilis]
MIYPGILLFVMLYGRGLAQDQTYVISAPKFIRVGASEQVVIQAYGYTQEFSVTISLKSYPDKITTYAFGTIQLTPDNRFQGSVALTVQPKDLRTDDPQQRVESIYLEATSPHFTRQKKMLLTYDNGFLFIQTDKPIYTPDQSVKVRVYSLNEELRPARRAAVLTFVDPGGVEVDIIHEEDATGIVSFPEFKIPPYPKFGIWTIKAKYDKEFTTSAIAKFQVKEYAMPRFSVEIIPENSFISSKHFERFKITILARYFYKKKLSEAEVYIRFGIVQGAKKNMLPKSLHQIHMEEGVGMLYFNSRIAIRELGYSELSDVDGATLYIAASVLETRDGHTEDAELTTVKYALSPYKLDLIATPLFVKPGLPYFIKARVRDILDVSVGNIPVVLQATALTDQLKETRLIEEGSDSGSGVSSPRDGTTIFTVNIPSDTKALEFKITTADTSLPEENQASETYEAKSYNSLSGSYLYISWASDHRVLQVGETVHLKVHPASHYIEKILHYSYLILSKGKIIKYGTQEKIQGLSYQGLTVHITKEMVPSARLLVYYIVTGEGTAELVADSVWLNVQQKCGNHLELRILKNGRVYKPGEAVSLSLTSELDSLVALSAMDKAIYGVTGSKQKSMEKALLQLEKSDLGCGAGGGENNADVFRMAGLTFLTNANADDPREKDETCTAIIRTARSLEPDIEKLVAQFQKQQFQKCCRMGAERYPFPQTCQQRIKRIRAGPRCIYAFRLCCEFAAKKRLNDTHKHLLLGRNAFNALLDIAPQIRSFFPESWLWEVHPVQRSKNLPVTLPDSLTTWEIQGVSISDKGICVAEPLEVEVVKDIFVNVHIPYSVVRGEQIELKATIYNYRPSTSKFCLKISVQKGICLFGAAKTLKDGSQANTCSHLKDIQSSSIMVETFKVLPLELGLLSVNLTLHSNWGKDILLKTLRVVPEGIRRESYDGATLDPQGVYGTVVRQKEFSYTVPRYIVPKTQLVRTLSIKGNLLGDVIQAAVKPEALKLLANLPQGSAERELMNIIPVFYVYDYLERTDSWDIFGSDRTSAEITLLRKMKRGIISVLSFQKQDFSYSMWKDGEASTWVTAFVLKVFGQVRRYLPDQFGTACTSLTWLIDICQMDDGSFREISDYKPVALQGTLRDQERENRMYLTAFTLIAFSEYKKPCPFQKFADAENRAMDYLLQNIAHSQNTFVLAIVTYALTQAKANHPDLHSAYRRLKSEAQVKGTPPAYRFWKETPIQFDASVPSEGNARMVETTAYSFLSILLRGDHDYAKPVMKWLTEEQRFGGGFYSTQDTTLALECLTEYSILVKRLALDMNVKASYKFQGDFRTYRLTRSNYIGRPVDASLKEDIEVQTTGSTTGTAAVTLRSVYYVSSISEDTCDFQLKVDVTLDEKKYYLSFNEVRLLFACAKYKPRRRTGEFSSPHAVMDISLPNGLEANEEDLALLSNTVDQMISNYEITPDGHVLMQVDSIPGNEFLCVGFRTTEIYRVGMSSPGTFSVYDYHDPDKKCTIFYNAYGEESLVKLCEGSECKCMEAECGHMQPQLDTSITLDTRKEAACQENIAYVYKVVIKSSKEEGSFVKYHAVLLEPYKLGVTFAEKNAEIIFIKKSSCTDIQLSPKENYLIMGKEALKTGAGANAKYQYPLDDLTWIEWWPSPNTVCDSCQAFRESLEEFVDDLFLSGC